MYNMKKGPKITLVTPIAVNGHRVTAIIIGRHYREKHAHYMNDEIILNLVMALDGGEFSPDSTNLGIEYYAADISLKINGLAKVCRLVWLFEGDLLEIIGVINAYRVKRKK